jgi:hypothetical protein
MSGSLVLRIAALGDVIGGWVFGCLALDVFGQSANVASWPTKGTTSQVRLRIVATQRFSTSGVAVVTAL